MATTDTPVSLAADVVEATVASTPGLMTERDTRPGGSEAIKVTRLAFAGWQIVISIVLFPIGLLALAAGKSPKVRGTIILSQLADGRTNIVGSSGMQSVDDKVLAALGTERSGQAVPPAIST